MYSILVYLFLPKSRFSPNIYVGTLFISTIQLPMFYLYMRCTD